MKLLLMAALVGVQNPAQAPEIGVRDTQGTLWTLEKLEKGKLYFVEFWATWCTTCRKISPVIEKFVEKNRGETFEHLSVSIDTDRRALIEYLKAKKRKYPVLLDPEFKMATAWKAKEVPRMFLVKDGLVRWQKTGEVTLEELEKARLAAK